MSFSFGFSGDDVDDAETDADRISDPVNGPNGVGTSSATGIAAREHDVRELLSTLPDRLHYSTIQVESPTGKVLQVPRRELFDVRIQLMAEDEASNDETLQDIEKSDIRTGIYEGGFKTWECSVDLASLLLDRGPRKDIDDLARCDQIIELGCGTALPTLVLFQHALQNEFPLSFTLQDYNESVLRLVTLPNLLLTWMLYTIPGSLDSGGDLEVSPELIERFVADLQSKHIELHFLSGSWSSEQAQMIAPSAPDMGTVILAAETIYSAAATTAFVDMIITLLRRVKMSKVMLGAKKFYFGVGGSVDGLKQACREQGAVAYEIENHGVPGLGSGVGRALVEIQMY